MKGDLENGRNDTGKFTHEDVPATKGGSGLARGHSIDEGDKPPMELVKAQRTGQYIPLSLH